MSDARHFANLEDFHSLSMTPDGRFVAFIANANQGQTLILA